MRKTARLPRVKLLYCCVAKLLKFKNTLFVFCFLLITNYSLLITPCACSTSAWLQTDWSGGQGSSTSSQYQSASNIDVTGTTGQASLEKREKFTNSKLNTNLDNWESELATPSGWIQVPGNDTYTGSDFFVMKYEAKCALNSDLTTGLTSPDTGYNTYDNDNTACTTDRQLVSVASGWPVTEISQTNSQTLCQNIGSAYHLITNDEWMTIARNAESVDSNWSGDSVGSGNLTRGWAAHTSYGDSWTNSEAAPQTDTDCLYNTGADTCGSTGTHLYKRTFTLSNGVQIWDISGNVYEWNSGKIECAADACTADEMPYSSDPDSEWVEYSSEATGWSGEVLATYGSLTWDDLGPLDNTYNSDQAIGRLYTDDNAAYPSDPSGTTHAFVRGGHWSLGASAGAFTLGLTGAPEHEVHPVGLRCASDSVEILQSYNLAPARGGGSAQISTTGHVNGTFTQSINVGDTDTYNLEAYVYTDGSAVTSADAQLYANGSAITTTYTNEGSGWYKLAGEITGADEERVYGVQIKAGKTAYLDNVSLYKSYQSNGFLTSNIYDTKQNSDWGTLSYSSSGGGSLSIKARTGNESDLNDAQNWSDCDAITNNTDITSNNCVNDTDRYIQYYASFTSGSTPVLESISIGYSPSDLQSPTSFTLISPKQEEHISSENLRPFFKWKAESVDKQLMVDKYTFEVGETATGSSEFKRIYNIENIPAKPTVGGYKHEEDKYIAYYGGYGDDDVSDPSTFENNYISIHTKESSKWKNNENNGELKIGKLTWKVSAIDGKGNRQREARGLFVDPKLPPDPGSGEVFDPGSKSTEQTDSGTGESASSADKENENLLQKTVKRAQEKLASSANKIATASKALGETTKKATSNPLTFIILGLVFIGGAFTLPLIKKLRN